MNTIKTQEAQQIFTVTLSRPEVKNAFDATMIGELTNCFRSLQKRDDVKAIVLQGEGSHFCAGADLNYMKSMVQFSFEENQEDANRLFEMFEVMAQISIPLVGFVQGAAFGGGVGLAAVCDYVLAEEKTQFCFSEVRLGLAPAVISPFVLSKVERGKVAPYMLSGKTFGATEAYQMGLAHQISKESDWEKQKNQVIDLFKAVGPESVRATKQLLLKVPHLNWKEAKKEVTQVIAARRSSQEGQEGIRCFLEKRKPNWSSN